jgi:hypothetical protein
VGVRCFWLTETPFARVELRRQGSRVGTCPDPTYGYHDAVRVIGWNYLHWTIWMPRDRTNIYLGARPDSVRDWVMEGTRPDAIPRSDPRWPPSCERCPYAFSEADEWQINLHALMRRADTGELVTVREAPPGAMWDAWWMRSAWWLAGPDGRHVWVKCPNGQVWAIDGEEVSLSLLPNPGSTGGVGGTGGAPQGVG